MKIFKKVATLTIALLFACGLGAFAACDNSGDSITSDVSTNSEESKTYTAYEFVVLNADGTKAADGYQVQLCNVETGLCISYFAPVVNGICIYEHALITAPDAYDVHLYTADYQEIALKETVRTSADAFGEYTLTLAE